SYRPIAIKNICGENFLYFNKFPRYESELKSALNEHIKHEAGLKNASGKIAHIMEEVLETRPVFTSYGRLELNFEQRLAVALALLKDFLIVSGGPGTGKTSIVITILRCLVRFGIPADSIFMTAPTGRASQRLADSLQNGVGSIKGAKKPADADLDSVRYGTIHRLLGYNPSTGNFVYNSLNRLPLKALVIDEVSMIDIVLMARLFEAIGPGTKIVLLGDKDQLPSVDAGAVLAELIPGGGEVYYSDAVKRELVKISADFKKIPVLKPASTHGLTDRIVILKRSYRSDEKILRAAALVNAQDENIAMSIPALPEGMDKKIIPEGVFFTDSAGGDLRSWHRTLDAWISMMYFSGSPLGRSPRRNYKELVGDACGLDLSEKTVSDGNDILESLFSYAEKSKILAFVKHGPFGTFAVNRYISRRLQPELDAGAHGIYFSGAQIMVTENDPIHGLYNGDVGIVIKTKKGGYRAIFRRSGGFISMPVSETPLSERAFAITVHKSQGSEYENILVALPQDGANRLLTKEIVYTALTRARRSAVLYGSRDILGKAAGRRIERQSGMKMWE
ncbi:MAG TPA: exodeoxyribonuclease V subunit alpha, partial [Candidatus Omnitrophota bacterium]|nr:exodeoxyribonuclease V subunit alpha [Candidatus Omnitrophota bacterium]